jgi:hypothetical protein
MRQLYRYILLPTSLVGAWSIASCSSNPPVQQCELVHEPDGSVHCVDQPVGAGGNTPSGTGGTTLPGTGGVVTPGVGGLSGTGSGSNAGTGGVVVGVGGTDSNPGNALGTIQVSADALARDHTIVTFSFPAGVGKVLVLKDEQGGTLPLQMSALGDDKATFILPALAAGATATYTVEESAALPEGVSAVEEGGHLFLKHGTTNIFRWLLVDDNFRGSTPNNVRAGYIFPLYTPSGKNVADDYQSDHPHMHGVWSAWKDSTFRDHKVDFWNGYANQGMVDLESMGGHWGGPVHGGLLANLRHYDITVTPNIDALKEVWVVTVYKTHDEPSPYYVFDIDSTQRTAGADKLVLDQTTYGGFGFRGSEQWVEIGSVQFLTSEGHNRTTGDAQRANWVAMYGNVDGAPAGYAAMGHPTNLRTPQGLRIHPSNPYWSFTPTTSLAGSTYTIDGGGATLGSRFRLVTFDGDADGTFLKRIYDDYATPPTVTVLP